MRIPIQYALTYPYRMSSSVNSMDISKLKELHFELPDFERFPCLKIAYEAGRLKGTYPCVLNASNEVAVEEFLKDKIRFTDIPRAIQAVLSKHKALKEPSLEDILDADTWARERTKEILSAFNN